MQQTPSRAESSKISVRRASTRKDSMYTTPVRKDWREHSILRTPKGENQSVIKKKLLQILPKATLNTPIDQEEIKNRNIRLKGGDELTVIESTGASDCDQDDDPIFKLCRTPKQPLIIVHREVS